MNIVLTFCIAFIYIIFAVYLMNAALVWQTIVGSGALSFKISLLVQLLGSMWTAMSGLSLILLVITAVFVGVNFVLFVRRVREARAHGVFGVIFSGASIFGLLTGGCAACGAPMLALFGLGLGAVAPIYFTILSIIAIIVLGVSSYFLSRDEQACVIR